MPAPASIRNFRNAIWIGWLLLCAAALVYTRVKPVPAALAVPIVLAFLAEYPFYLLPGFPAARDRLMSGGKVRAASILAASALAPWLIYVLLTGHFSAPSLMMLCGIALVTCFWYVLLPAHPVADLLYLCVFAYILLFKIFTTIYPPPLPKLEISILGHLMLIRVMATSFTAIRGGITADYRFLPTRSEFLAGLRWFAFLMPTAGLVYRALGLVIIKQHPVNIILTIGTFFGILWTVSISEEFIFRGLLQPWFEKWLSSPIAALVITSLLFGSIHLSFHFHGGFPNWRFSAVAAVLGLFCGLARRQTGGIQAGMVAHALTVAVWKMFLQ